MDTNKLRWLPTQEATSSAKFSQLLAFSSSSLPSWSEWICTCPNSPSSRWETPSFTGSVSSESSLRRSFCVNFGDNCSFLTHPVENFPQQHGMARIVHSLWELFGFILDFDLHSWKRFPLRCCDCCSNFRIGILRNDNQVRFHFNRK